MPCTGLTRARGRGAPGDTVMATMPGNVAKTGGCPTARGPRLSKADVHVRVEFAHRLLAQDKSRIEIVEAMRARFKMSTRAADRYLARARERAEKEAATGRDAMRVETVKRLDALSRKAEKANQFASAVGAERLRAQTLGLLAAQELEVKNTVTVATPPREDLTPAQIREEMAELIDFVAECVTHGTIEVTPELVANVGRLSAAVHATRSFQ